MPLLGEVRALHSAEVGSYHLTPSQWVHLKAKYIIVYLEMIIK